MCIGYVLYCCLYVEPSILLLHRCFLYPDKHVNPPLGINLLQYLNSLKKNYLPYAENEITNNIRIALKTLIEKQVI